MLRKRGRRAEQVVQAVENELRSWSGAEGLDDVERTHGTGFGQPRVIDSVVVDVTPEYSIAPQSNANRPIVQPTPVSEESTRSLPRAFTAAAGSSAAHTSSVLESFYTADGVPASRAASQRTAIIELVREPGHLVWAVADGFERLIVHLLARYYELLSFSEFRDRHCRARLTVLLRSNAALGIHGRQGIHAMLPNHAHPPSITIEPRLADIIQPPHPREH